ncbi:hypothetical protein SAMN04488498_10541 [Mesorhizobium albiziae]|uniref:Uncharacterized protein n=1 Tax=Neomesorhizobium albiziae TaxID=335020 RepID=A0A1I3YP07_9HYPH|nr:hypothetical protein [Mesorhizobium albiziae]SFK33011.1 hypothetical protein SAMN04488498_10541 [Mesorhizobium albiziae]
MPERGNGTGREAGTRFRLFAQPPFLKPFREPETVWVSSPAGSVGPGPADDRMYVVDPIGKRAAYGLSEDRFGNAAYVLPPWPGPAFPPALPDADGHFDGIEVESPEFEAAHLFGVVRRTLDVWEGYFGHPIEWHFARDFDQLELVLQRNLVENAFMGYGFLEVGIHRASNGAVHPFSLNFDIIAHEVGHCIVYAVVGVPNPETTYAEYYGFHESAADLTALIAALHFDSVIDELLAATHGNLYTLNLVNRIAELTGNDQIRLAANPLSLLDFVGGWRDEHDLAQPLTGAIFDMLVDIFHEELVERGLFSADAEDLSDRMEDQPDYHQIVQPIFDETYAAAPDGFREALVSARDTVGIYLAETWRRLSPDYLGYDDVGRTLFAVDQMLTGGRYSRIIDVNLRRRAIGAARVGPQLAPRDRKSHFELPRVFMPERQSNCCRRRSSYRERLEMSRRRV